MGNMSNHYFFFDFIRNRNKMVDDILQKQATIFFLISPDLLSKNTPVFSLIIFSVIITKRP